LAGAEPDPVAPAIASGLWLGFLLYAYWYSSFGGRQPSKKISIGQRLPSFAVLNSKDERIDSVALASKPAILIFYRGDWCPLCVAQINELVGLYRQISAMGVRVALISSQPHENTVALSKKFDVDFDFLTDQGNAAARALGIENPHGLPMGMQVLGYDSETVVPTVIITDRQGKVIWAHETDNYRVRPEPNVYLEVLKSNGIALIET
jgi:peroxiredoxin